MTDDANTGAPPPIQGEQAKLLRAGMSRPGIAEVMRVYGALTPYVQEAGKVALVVRFSTGGNR